MIRITKGDITIECETQADVRLALGVFADVDVPALPEVVNAPAWRVGGPRAWKPDPLPPLGVGLLGEVMVPDIPKLVAPKLVAVPEMDPIAKALFDTQVDLPKPEAVPTSPHIPVRPIHLEVLEAIMLFPEGVPSKGIQQLLGLSESTTSGRLQRLREQELIERLPHKNLWRATSLARRAKLVRS